jgi:hypothetical protein
MLSGGAERYNRTADGPVFNSAAQVWNDTFFWLMYPSMPVYKVGMPGHEKSS